MKTTFTSLLLSFIVLAKGQSYNGPGGVEYDALHQRYIVTNYGSNNLQQVIPGSAPTLFVANVSAPRSLAIVGDTVYVICDTANLRGYNLTTGTLAVDINLGSCLLIGICTDLAGNLFITEWDTKKIIRYNIASQQHNYFVGNSMTDYPNGIVYDPFHNRLVLVTGDSNAPIFGISLVDSTVTTLITTTFDNPHGITIDGEGNFYISEFEDNIYFLDSAFANAPIKLTGWWGQAIDISYNILSDTLAVPDVLTDLVTFHGFPRPRLKNDFDTVIIGYAKTICMMQNDSISGNVLLSLQDYSAPQLGSATTVGNCIVYIPAFEGTDTITYTVCSVDTPSFCRTAYLYVTNVVDSTNNAPIAGDDTASTNSPNPIIINVATNDIDALADTLCVTSIIGSSFFSLDTTNCANIIFTPDSFFVGNDTATYVICDNGLPALCDTARLIVKVDSCSPPVFTLLFKCKPGYGSPNSCYFWGSVIMVGEVSDSVTWHIQKTVSWSPPDIDITLQNDDTLVIGPTGTSSGDESDIELPWGPEWIVCATSHNFCGSKTVCDTITIWWSTISEIPLSNIRLFPNPANNILTIDMSDNEEDITRNYSAIEILDAVGNKQKSVSRKGTNKTVTLDTSDLPAGLYLATLTTEKHERRTLGKFSIQR